VFKILVKMTGIVFIELERTVTIYSMFIFASVNQITPVNHVNSKFPAQNHLARTTELVRMIQNLQILIVNASPVSPENLANSRSHVPRTRVRTQHFALTYTNSQIMSADAGPSFTGKIVEI